MPDAVPPIHAVSSHVATDKGSSIDGGKFKFRKTDGRRIGNGNSISGFYCDVSVLICVLFYICLPNYNEISGGHI